MSDPRSKSRARSYFSYITEAGSHLAIVFAYLNGELSSAFSQREGKQRAADAMLAFWKPYALRAKDVDGEAVQIAAQSSVGALLRQVQSICDDFGIRSPLAQNTLNVELLLTALASRIGSMDGGDMTNPAQSVAMPAPSSSPEPSSVAAANEDLIFASDEDLLGDLA